MFHSRRLLYGLAMMPIAISGDALAAEAEGLRMSGSDHSAQLDYTGDHSRIGISVDGDGEVGGEFRQAFGLDEDSAFIGEGWARDGAGGLKLNYHWLAADQQSVYKLFAAVDQNDEEDRKATLGAGIEGEELSFGAYLSAAFSDERLVGTTEQRSSELLTGVDQTGFWQQQRDTILTTQRYAHPYDYGVGVRLSRFLPEDLWRVEVGADYEWGDYSSNQWTMSLGLEKYFAGTGHSVALDLALDRSSGDFEADETSSRALLTWRYAFGESYRPRHVAPEPVAVTAEAPPATPVLRKQIVKHELAMSSDTYFALDSARLNQQFIGEINGIAEQLKQRELAGKISLVGHTCDLGTDAYNLDLSERRANAVRDQLIAAGIAADRILTEGRGESQPLHPNDSEANRSRNRRVNIQFLVIDETEESKPMDIAAPQVVQTAEPVTGPAAWIQRALLNPIGHKREVDVYHYEVSDTRVELGEKEYINRLPSAQDDTASALRNGGAVLIDVLANDTDPDGDGLTVVSVTQPAGGGRVENFGDLVSFTPDAGFSGETEFTYIAADPSGGQSEARVRVTVNNSAPVAGDDMAETARDVAVTIDVLANDSDPDGDAIELVSVSDPGNGTARVENGQVVYEPTNGFFGTEQFSYTIRDAEGATAQGSITVEVAEFANNPPVAVDDKHTTSYLPAITVDVLANDSDPDGDPLTVTGFQGLPSADIGRFEINADNTVTFYAADGWNRRVVEVTYLISDGRGGTASALLTIVDP